MVLLLLALVAGAPAPYTCTQEKTDDLIGCAYSKFKRADAALNAQWKRMGKGPELMKAQRAWVAFRNAECEAESPASPEGREYPVYIYLCQAELTDQRTKQLHDNYQGR
jgi:uncharacterized protein YecT (DUF1311 family)